MSETKEPITLDTLDKFYRIHNFTISQTGIDIIKKALEEKDIATLTPFLEAVISAATKHGPIN